MVAMNATFASHSPMAAQNAHILCRFVHFLMVSGVRLCVGFSLWTKFFM